MTTQNSLASKAMLADLTIGLWTGKLADQKVTSEVHDMKHAQADAGVYIKKLVNGNALTPLHSVLTSARKYHHTHTLPGFDGGRRVLPNVCYLEYASAMQKLRQEYDEAADAFCKDYPRLIKKAELELGKMFNALDYLSPSEIRRKFSFRVSVMPFPDVSDFRFDLDKEALEELRTAAITEFKDLVPAMRKDILERVQGVVGHMANRLSEYEPARGKGEKAKNTFRDSLVSNVEELADLIPMLNVTDDAKLAKLAGDMKKKLCVAGAEVLREDEATREKVAGDAVSILKQVNAFMA